MRWIFVFLALALVVRAHSTTFQTFEESGKVGLKNEQGLVVLPPAFEALGWSDGSFSVIGEITGYKLNGNWGLINLKKEFITKADYESLVFSGADRVIAIKQINGAKRKAGSLTFAGAITIPFQYDAVTIYGLRAIVMNKVGVEYQFGLTDLEHKTIIPVQYSSIYPVSSLRFAVGNEQNKFALFSDAGKQVTDFFIDSISQFHRNYAIIHSNGWKGIMNRDGIVVAEPLYRDVKFSNDGAVQVLTRDNWKVLDEQNQLLKSLQADVLETFQTDRYRVTRAGRVGVIDSELQEVWPFDFEFIGLERNGYVAAKKNKKWGLLSLKREPGIPFGYDSLIWDGDFAIALSREVGKSRWWLINERMSVKSMVSYDFIRRWDDVFLVRRNGFEGLLSADGRESVHCVYDSILHITNQQVLVKFKNLYGIISKAEQWILAPQKNPLQLVNDSLYLERQDTITFLKSFRGDIVYFTSNPIYLYPNGLKEKSQAGETKRINFRGVRINPSEENPDSEFNDGLRVFQNQGKFGFVDDRDRLRIPNRYDSVKPFSNGMAAFKLLGRWGYLDTDDKMWVHPTYDYAGEFIDGYAIVTRNGKTGLIDKKGEVMLALQYDSVSRFDSYLKVFVNQKIGLANKSGRMLIQPRFDYLKTLDNGQVIVGIQDRYGVVTADGLSVVPIIYASLNYVEIKKQYLAHLPSEWATLDLPKNQ